MSVLESALDLASDRGLPLVPCRADKRPLQTAWTTTEWRSVEQVAAAFAAPGVELIGVRTGQVSGLLVVDVDPRNGGDAWYRENFEKLACQRIHQTRGSGYHLLYRLPPGLVVKSRANALAPGVDIKAEGGQIIWWPAHGCAVAVDDEPGPPPEWLVKAITEKPARANGHDHGAVREGGRNQHLTAQAGRLRRAGLKDNSLAAALMGINAADCSPPLPDAEVANILKQAAGWKGGDPAPDTVDFTGISIPSLADVHQTKVPPRTWFFDQLIPAGAFLIVGRPKVGKSWLLLQLALAAARGLPFLGYSNVKHRHD